MNRIIIYRAILLYTTVYKSWIHIGIVQFKDFIDEPKARKEPNRTCR